MKKTFALVLAIAMVMSLAAVSFAATNLVSLTGPYKYDSDKDDMDSAYMEYGKGTYYLIKESGVALTTYKSVEKLKVKAKWEMGGDLVESVSVVKKYVDNLTAETGTAGYYYFVEVKVAAKETTSDADIIGTLTFNRKAVKDGTTIKFVEIKDEDEDITFNVFYKNTFLNEGSVAKTIKGDREDLKWDTNYALKFDYDDEVELSFGSSDGGNNEGTFTVDVSGQGKIFFKYNTKADDAIVVANPGAKLKFINFNNAKFNRTGEFMYEMEDGAYAYQIVDGKLAAIPGCEYDESDEAFYFYTRTLGSYVFSDVELVNPAVDAPAVTAPTEVTNPGTGAAA